MNLHHSSMFVGIALALSLVSSTTGAPATDLPSTPLTGRYDDLQLPIYAPPKNVLPRARVDGALRGKGSADVEIVALVPDHIGLTVKQTPTLNWYLSKPTAYPLRFTLNNTDKIRPIYEGPLSTPPAVGVHTIDLKTLGLTLKPNVQYRWFVSASPDSASHASHIVAGGMIERCEFSECIVTISPKMACDQDSVRTNATIGLWYDAMGCVCTDREKPNRPFTSTTPCRTPQTSRPQRRSRLGPQLYSNKGKMRNPGYRSSRFRQLNPFGFSMNLL